MTSPVERRRGLLEIVTRSRLHRMKGALLRERGVQVMDVPMLRAEIDPTVDEANEPARNYVCVLASSVRCLRRVVRPHDVLRFVLNHDPASVKGADPLRRVHRQRSVQEDCLEISIWSHVWIRGYYLHL